ncbi:uncharacterized protein LOC62_01G001612 [Vanrija pseudolonga]|uniref:Uncharacterized protein n=1 Tax=Vanrija pseudolonga TaxID=143232 RepID=A0AAF1BJ84_9TREE|nr:hypothetical protein LOC62_01G001612 [Vanrija pseudolonga]
MALPPSAASSLASQAIFPDSSPAHILLNCQHIVDSILSCTDRDTLVTCLRVKSLHDVAGAQLYHTVRLDAGSIEAFFRVATAPPDPHGSIAPALNLRDTRKGKLLARVCVLSIGSHASTQCAPYARSAALLTGLDTLRIVRMPRNRQALELFCHDGIENCNCKFLKTLSPRKIVLRNIDFLSHGSTFIKFHNPSATTSLRELVWVVPNDHLRFPHRVKLRDGEWKYPSVCRVVLIFAAQWEDWRQPNNTENLPIQWLPGEQPPLITDTVVAPMALCRNQAPVHPHTIYGMETVVFQTAANSGDIIGDLNALATAFGVGLPVTFTFPETQGDALREAQAAIVAQFDSVPPPPSGGNWVSFKTMEVYSALEPAVRRTDRTTLVTCLRVNKAVHEAAGTLLYHTVRVTEEDLSGFIDGAVAIGAAQQDSPHATLSDSTKGRLLAKVRVFSLSNHGNQLCLRFGPIVGALLTGLDTFRAVSAAYTSEVLWEFCCRPMEGGCKFLESCQARKLVVRNVSAETIMFHCFEERAAVEEMVLVLSPNRDRYLNDWTFAERARAYSDERLKIVFDDSWETWSPPMLCIHPDHNVQEHECINDYRASLPVPTEGDDVFIRTLQPLLVTKPLFDDKLGAEARAMTIYGFETVPLRDDYGDELIAAFRRFSGEEGYESDDADEAEETEGAAYADFGDDFIEVEVEGGSPVTYLPDEDGNTDYVPYDPVTDPNNLKQDQLTQLVMDEVLTGSLTAARKSKVLVQLPPTDKVKFRTMDEYARLDPAERRYELDDGPDSFFA